MDDTKEKRGNKWSFRRKWKSFLRHVSRRRVLYPTYIIAASLFCVAAAQLSHGSSLRVWIYRLTHDEVVKKGVEYNLPTEELAYGEFMTHYRYQEFGATNPSKVDANAPMVALTFDDGPNPNVTTRILKALGDNYSHATFFVVGSNAEKYQDTLKQIADAGCEIGNHTNEHKDLTSLDSEERAAQIEMVNQTVKKATGSGATVVRPPYGAYDDDVLSEIQVPVVLWNLDTEDWDSRNAKTVVDKVLAEVRDGDIILMHDIYESTAEAVEMLVPMLKEQGYQVLSVSEMAHYKGRDLECHKPYGEIADVKDMD